MDASTTDWIVNRWPPNAHRVEAKAKDGIGSYVLPFLIRRGADGKFRNAKTGHALECQIVAWRYPPSTVRKSP